MDSTVRFYPLAPALMRSAQVAANRQRQRFKLARVRLYTSTVAFQDPIRSAAGSLFANWWKLMKRGIATNKVLSTPDLRQDKPEDASRLHSDNSPEALKNVQPHETSKERPPALSSILAEESDRGAVVLVVSLADGLLADRIIAALPHGDRHRDDLLGQAGVLNSFQAKITMSQVLGIIGSETAEHLSILASMRIICTQSKNNISLRTRELQDVFFLLLGEDAVELVRTATNQEFPRLLFNAVVVYNFEMILGASPAQAKRVFDDMLRDTF